MTEPAGFVPPPYPVRPPRPARRRWRRGFDGGIVDLSIGTPCDPPTAAVVAALGAVEQRTRVPAEHRHRGAAQRDPRAGSQRRFDVDVPITQIAACVGTKELVATTPQYLRLRTPDRATPCCIPAVAYPTYEMGAMLAGCRAVPVPADADGGIDLTLDRPGRRGAGADAVGQQPVQPDRCARAISALPRHGAARTTCRCSATSATSSSPGTAPPSTHPAVRARRRRRGALAVEALEPRRGARRLLRRRRRARRLPAGGAQARRHAGARARRRRPGSRRSATTPTSSCNAIATGVGSSGWRACCRRGRGSTSRCPPAGSTCGSTPTTAGRSPSGSPGRRGARQPRRLLRRGRCAQRACRRGTT